MITPSDDAPSDHLTQVVERERRFFNTTGWLYSRLRLLIWRAIGEYARIDEQYTLFDAQGKRVLLYGCGPGAEVELLARKGAAEITGIDISDRDIASAQANAARLGLGDNVRFLVQDAHHTDFPDASFDLVVGTAILHHLDLRLALAELKRLLAPGGVAVFQEPLAANPLLVLGRLLTPGARTSDEHPLTAADWQTCAEFFPRFTHREVELTSLVLAPLNLITPRSLHRRLAPRVKALDDWLLRRFPGLGRFARVTFLILE
jgi:SAM-dependent methyltransferase